jgi:hypothetical protein
MVMTAKRIDANVTADGLAISGYVFDKKLPLERYQGVLGAPSRTIAVGPPAPAGHRNNQVHIFDAEGIYLTEHHASRLIESVNFIFNPADSPFPIESAFCGSLKIDGNQLLPNMPEADLHATLFARDLPGEYSVKYKNCWVGVSAKGRRDSSGKRRRPRYVVRVSVCL